MSGGILLKSVVIFKRLAASSLSELVTHRLAAS